MSANAGDESPHVNFALIHASSFFSNLSAFIALNRCENLLEDLNILSELRDVSAGTGRSFGYGWFGLEIVSYYAVGFVTCLEWHARSRLTDLLSYRPDAIRPDDLRSISDKVLSQAISKNAPVPYVLGAIAKVSDFDRYCGIFARVLQALGAPDHPKRVVAGLEERAQNPQIVDEIDPSLSGMLDGLFEFRNHLVHEIDNRVIGPYTLRDNWDIDTARKFGKATRLVMGELERLITLNSPEQFPNRLDLDGNPVDQLQLLQTQINLAEDQLGQAIKREGNSEANDAWQRSLEAYKVAQAAEHRFIECSEFLAPMRYFDPRAELQQMLLGLRLKYLKAVLAEVPEDLAVDEDAN